MNDSAHPQAKGLANGLAALGLDLPVERQGSLLAYMDLLGKWNKTYNLTAVRDAGEMLTHHVLDSLALVKPLQQHGQGRALRVLDVGSGGGLPGVVIAVACPQMDVTCVDAVAKKASFIQYAAGALKLPNLHGVHARVEVLDGMFDVVTSRAFASLADFCALSVHALARQGVWVAMKGKHPEDEMAGLPPDVQVFHVEPLQVPGLDASRCLVWMRRK